MNDFAIGRDRNDICTSREEMIQTAMINKLIDFLYEHCVVLMIIGFILSVVSILVYMQTRFYGNAVPQIAAGCAITGFVTYIIGRILMATRKQHLRKQETKSPSAKDDA